MYTEAELQNMDDEDLDELVFDCKLHEATLINNEGKEAQIIYVMEFHANKEAELDT
jgi:hypothetical protein